MESTPYSKVYSDVSHPHSSSSSCGGGSSVGNGCIEHAVTKFDTLAGVAIKYGVEVADIKRMNGLTTDLQMFARKSLRIPPGRHAPSPISSNGYHTQGQTSSDTSPPNRRYSDSYNSIRSLKLSSSPQRNISSSINSLRDYYRLTPNDHNGVDEMTNAPLGPLLSGPHWQSKGKANGFPKIPVANEKVAATSDKNIDKLVRRRKSEVDLNNSTPDMLLKQDNKGLALRSKAVSRTSTESESGLSNMFPVRSKDSLMVQGFCGVRKSSSAPTFQQSENNNEDNNNNTSSIWRTPILNFTLDFQALSTMSITSQLFDGLPKPTSGRKKKPARD